MSGYSQDPPLPLGALMEFSVSPSGVFLALFQSVFSCERAAQGNGSLQEMVAALQLAAASPHGLLWRDQQGPG